MALRAHVMCKLKSKIYAAVYDWIGDYSSCRKQPVVISGALSCVETDTR